jgi:hypothetical protein
VVGVPARQGHNWKHRIKEVHASARGRKNLPPMAYSCAGPKKVAERFPRKQRQRSQDRSLLRQSRERKPEHERPPTVLDICGRPECESRSREVYLRQRTLRKIHRVDRHQCDGRPRHRQIGCSPRKPKQTEQRKRTQRQHGCAGDEGRVSKDTPSQRQPCHYQRRMRIRQRGMRDQRARQK